MDEFRFEELLGLLDGFSTSAAAQGTGVGAEVPDNSLLRVLSEDDSAIGRALGPVIRQVVEETLFELGAS